MPTPKKQEAAYTVRELMKRLRKLVKEHPEAADATVSLEGCDCDGDWRGGVRYFDARGTILLER